MKFKKSTPLLFIFFSFLLSALLAWFLHGRWLSVADIELEIRAFLASFRDQPVAAEPVQPAGPVTSRQTDAPAWASHGTEFHCYSGDPTGIADLPEGKIYRWLDSLGGVHYGDRPPRNVELEIVDIGYREKDYFDLKIHYPAGAVPAGLKDAVAVGGKAVYRVYSGYLSLPRMSKSTIAVKVFGQPASYAAYRHKVAPDVPASTNGFYSWARNEAVVLHRGSATSTRQTALHEATHVINARNFGVMPKWFNEGTAEFFEHLSVNGQQISVAHDTDWLRGLGRQYRVLPLRQLLDSGQSDWDGELRTTYYANAWALVYFLMLPENRALMRAFQLELASDRCDDIDSAGFFERHHAGGVARLEQDWRQWLARPQRVAVRF